MRKTCATEAPSLVGTVIDRKYRLDALIGRGSLGEVYQATHLVTDIVMAVKVWRLDAAMQTEAVETFKRAARDGKRLEHPNAIQVLDFGEDASGLLYLVTYYLVGRDLCALLEQEWPLSLTRVLDIMWQILDVLHIAHANDILHLALKPQNIFVSPPEDYDPDHVTVCDFSVARLSPFLLAGDSSAAYLSPEQVRGDELDARSDLYSAGVVLFQLLTRWLPWSGDSPPTLSEFHAMHPALDAVCLRALSMDPAARYPTARDMQHALAAAVAAANPALGGIGAPPVRPRHQSPRS